MHHSCSCRPITFVKKNSFCVHNISRFSFITSTQKKKKKKAKLKCNVQLILLFSIRYIVTNSCGHH